MNNEKKVTGDIKTYVKGFHIEGNISGLNMPLFYSKTSATGDLGKFLSFEDKDVYETATELATKLVNHFAKLKRVHSKKLNMITRSEFQKMYALDIIALCSRKQFDNMTVEAVEFFTQLFLNSYVESKILNKEVSQVRRGNERHNRVSYTPVS